MNSTEYASNKTILLTGIDLLIADVNSKIDVCHMFAPLVRPGCHPLSFD
jgi:hypothetical protein